MSRGKNRQPLPVPITEGACATCACWRVFPDGKTGQCRRYPPVVPAGAVRASFPETAAADGCWEYRTKESAHA